LSSGSRLPTFAADLVTGVPRVIEAGDELSDADVPERWCRYLDVRGGRTGLSGGEADQVPVEFDAKHTVIAC